MTTTDAVETILDGLAELERQAEQDGVGSLALRFKDVATSFQHEWQPRNGFQWLASEIVHTLHKGLADLASREGVRG